MEQIRNLTKLVEFAREIGPKKIAVACAADPVVLTALENSRREGIINAILVDDENKIKEEAKNCGVDLENYEIVDCKGLNSDKALEAVKLVSSDKADILMKGMLETSDFLRSVLNKEYGLLSGKILSHAYIHEIQGWDRLIIITDGVFNTYPELKDKLGIVNNVITLCHKLGIETPKIACLAAVEVINPKMQATLDAAALTQMNRRGQIKGCIVDGPFALDNAVSRRSASHKGIEGEVAGRADVLLVPNIDCGNPLFKSIVYFAESKTAGLILGTKKPVILTSRADTAETKFLSIATAVATA